MSQHPAKRPPGHSDDLLEQVTVALNEYQGDLKDVEKVTGVNYYALLRIKQRRKNDPGYSKVAALHRYFFPEQYAAPADVTARAAPAQPQA